MADDVNQRAAAIVREAARAERVVGANPDLVERLDNGDPLALLALLEAAGGTVGQATVRVCRG